MKKVMVLILNLLLLFSFFSCESTATQSNINGDVITEVKASSNGIKITIPKEGRTAPLGYIYRYVKDENGKLINDMIISIYQLKDTHTTYVYDYFVDKGKMYFYEGHYEGRGFNNFKTLRTSVIAKGGKGEIGIPKNIKGNYDEKLGVMNFTPPLSFSKNVIELTNNNSEWYSTMAISYNCPDVNYERLVPHIKDNKACFFDDRSPSLAKMYGHDLHFFAFRADLSHKNISYDLQVSSVTLPSTITLPDNRKELILKDVEKGIEITLPPVPDVYKTLPYIYGILDISTNGDNKGMSESIQVSWAGKEENKSVLDYFVKGGNEYEYTYTLFDENRNVLLSTKSAKIKYRGKDNMKDFYVPPKMSYDKERKAFTITSFPQIKEGLTDKKCRIRSTARYSVINADPSLHWESTMFEVPIEEPNSTIYIKDLRHNDYIYNKDMKLSNYITYINIGDVHYNKLIEPSVLKDLPSTIYVKK